MKPETVRKRYEMGLTAGRGVPIKKLKRGQHVYTPSNRARFEEYEPGHGFRFVFESHWKDIGANGYYLQWYADDQSDELLVPIR